jgi:hypothetical protein
LRETLIGRAQSRALAAKVESGREGRERCIAFVFIEKEPMKDESAYAVPSSNM